MYKSATIKLCVYIQSHVKEKVIEHAIQPFWTLLQALNLNHVYSYKMQ